MIWIFILPLSLFRAMAYLAIALVVLVVRLAQAAIQLLALGAHRLDLACQQRAQQRRPH
jgi:hypothetical protein